MSRAALFGLAALAAVGAPLTPALAAGAINDDPVSKRLATECLLEAAAKLPKIYGFKIISESMEQKSDDLFAGAFLVSAVHRTVYYDFQCLAATTADTDLTGKTTNEKRVSKVWLSLRVPIPVRNES